MTVAERKEENALIDKVIRHLTKQSTPEFYPGGVPVKIAAAVYGKGPCFVQEGIRAGWLPIGHCRNGDQKDNFYISPRKLWEDTGFLYRGQTIEEIEKMKEEVRTDCIKRQGADL